MGGLAALAMKGLDEHTLTFDSHAPKSQIMSCIIVFAKKSNIQVGRMGGLAALAMKGLDEHTLTFDSHTSKK